MPRERFVARTIDCDNCGLCRHPSRIRKELSRPTFAFLRGFRARIRLFHARLLICTANLFFSGSRNQPAQLPRFEHARGIWVCEWFDGGVQRRVEAITVRESWTQYDPELTEREYLPKEKRRELRKK